MPNHDPVDDTRVGSALIIAIIGLLLPTILVVLLAFKNWKPNDIVTVVGCFTGLVGTLVGAFLGVQVGSAGKQKAETFARKAISELSQVSPEKARDLLS